MTPGIRHGKTTIDATINAITSSSTGCTFPHTCCVANLPPVALTNLGLESTEAAVPHTEITHTQGAVPSLLQISTPNSAESACPPAVVSKCRVKEELLLLRHCHL